MEVGNYLRFSLKTCQLTTQLKVVLLYQPPHWRRGGSVSHLHLAAIEASAPTSHDMGTDRTPRPLGNLLLYS